LGSGTQLTMAVHAGLLGLLGLKLPQTAPALGRGRRSQIGSRGFWTGGMHVHGMPLPGDEPFRGNVPELWRFLLVTPSHEQGLCGTPEQRAFQQMPLMPIVLRDRLCRLVLETWRPALDRQDFVTFSEAMYEFGVTIGEYFAPYQGGAFAHPRMAELVTHLRQRGVSGVAQSSWGPTIAALCADEAAARNLQLDLAADARWADCALRIAAPLNRGATIASV